MNVINRTGFTDTQALAKQLSLDLAANGFTSIWPDATHPNETQKFTLEATTAVDSLADAQKWRINLTCNTISNLRISVATPIQITSDGLVSYYDDGKTVAGNLGSVGADFIDRSTYEAVYQVPNQDPMNGTVENQNLSYPMSYTLVTTNHGIALAVWEAGSEISGKGWGWFVVQRSVDNQTGVPRVTGKAPLHCVFGFKQASGVKGMQGRFVVRESDISKPTLAVASDLDTTNSTRILNSIEQVAITEDGNFVVTFPTSLNTSRFSYPTDELDLIAYTSANVIGQGSKVTPTLYGEAQAREYTAQLASGPDNTGMRCLLLTGGGANL